MLVKFRENPFVAISDISKAFHRILIHKDHRKYTRFLWIGNQQSSQQVMQFKVLIFGATSSPYILQQTLKTHLSDPKHVVPGLYENFYEDNFLKSYPTENLMIEEKSLIDEIMNKASMPLQG